MSVSKCSVLKSANSYKSYLPINSTQLTVHHDHDCNSNLCDVCCEDITHHSVILQNTYTGNVTIINIYKGYKEHSKYHVSTLMVYQTPIIIG